jgi:hypothetical protein
MLLTFISQPAITAIGGNFVWMPGSANSHLPNGWAGRRNGFSSATKFRRQPALW